MDTNTEEHHFNRGAWVGSVWIEWCICNKSGPISKMKNHYQPEFIQKQVKEVTYDEMRQEDRLDEAELGLA